MHARVLVCVDIPPCGSAPLQRMQPLFLAGVALRRVQPAVLRRKLQPRFEAVAAEHPRLECLEDGRVNLLRFNLFLRAKPRAQRTEKRRLTLSAMISVEPVAFEHSSLAILDMSS